MSQPLTDQELLSILDQTLRQITHHMGRICLHPQQTVSPEETYTVYTTFEGGYRATLILCMDAAFLFHLAQQVLDTDVVTAQDMEDTAKEFFNVLCGNIASRLFQCAHISTRFHIPVFQKGRLAPPEDQCRVLSYAGCRREGIQLIHHIPALPVAL